MSDVDEQAPVFIGLCGVPSAGQSTVARILAGDYGIQTYSVNEMVRSVLATTDPLLAATTPLSRVVSEMGWETAETHRVFGAETRGLLERLREAVQEAVGASAWMDALERRVHLDRDDTDPPCVCIEDISSDAEALWVRARGGQVWTIDRPVNPSRGPRTLGVPVSPDLVHQVVRNEGTRTDLRQRLAELVEPLCFPSTVSRESTTPDLDVEMADRLLRTVRDDDPGTSLGPAPDA